MTDGAVAILELGVILLALVLNPSHRRREIEKALTMDQSGENTARSSFADDDAGGEGEEGFETAREEDEVFETIAVRRGLERGGRTKRDIEDVDESPLLK